MYRYKYSSVMDISKSVIEIKMFASRFLTGSTIGKYSGLPRCVVLLYAA